MKHIEYFFRFNSTIRKQFLDAFDELPWEEMVKDRGASFESIFNVYVHILGCHRFWFDVVNGKGVGKYRGNDAKPVRSMSELRNLEADVDAMITQSLQGISVDDLEEEFYINAIGGKMTVESILLHLIEEELQHIGEINCLFWQMGIEPPHLKEAAK